MRLRLVALAGAGLLVLLAGCQLRSLPALRTAPEQASAVATPLAARGEVAIAIRWPLRPQVLPTSAQRLRFDLTGPVTRTVVVDRPAGASPVSQATMSVEVGAGYALTVRAYAESQTPGAEPDRLVAIGQTALPFEVRPNQVATVRITLVPQDVPRITSVTADQGGPGSYVEITCVTGEALPSFRFGGVVSSLVSRVGEDRFSVRVPEGATSGGIVPIAAGVAGEPFGQFTVLGALGVQPTSRTVRLSEAWLFTATATSAEGAPIVAPRVSWELSTDSIGVIDPASGSFMASGGTGSAVVRAVSGRLLASASITVIE